VRDVMATHVLTLPASRPAAELSATLVAPETRRQRLYPVLDDGQRLIGVIGRTELEQALGAPDLDVTATTADLMRRQMTVAYDDETLRTAADQMSAAHVRTMPVVDRNDPDRLVGLVNLFDLFRARERLLTEERHRERVLRVRLAPPASRWPDRPGWTGRRGSSTTVADDDSQGADPDAGTAVSGPTDLDQPVGPTDPDGSR
jgi:CIC family chloride channel protein